MVEILIFVALPALFVLLCAWLRFHPGFQWRGNVGLGAVLVVLLGSVFGREFFAIEAGPLPITIDRLLLGGLFFMFFYWVFEGTERLRNFNVLDLILIWWLIMIAYSTMTHDWKFLKSLPLSRLIFFNILPFTVYCLARHSNLSVPVLRTSLLLIGLFSIYLAITAALEVKVVTPLIFPKYIMTSETIEFLGRGRGPFLNPVSNGIYLIVGFCCLLTWWPRKQGLARIPLLMGAGVVAVGAYCTLTRSVWLSLVVACGVFIWYPANRQLKGLMIILGVMVGVAAFPVIGEKVFSFKRDKAVSADDMAKSALMRPMFAAVAWEMFEDRPLWGVGYGNYSKHKFEYLKASHALRPRISTRGLTQHNVFLAYLTETGLVGMLTLIFMLSLMFWRCWQLWHDMRLNLWARQFALVSGVCVTVYSLNGLFHDVSIIPQGQALLMCLLGLVNNIHDDRGPFLLQASQPEFFVPQSVPAGSELGAAHGTLGIPGEHGTQWGSTGELV